MNGPFRHSGLVTLGFRVSARGITLPRMLRRVARVLRIVLLILGVSSLVWLPLSFFIGAGCISTLYPKGGMTSLGTSDGKASLAFHGDVAGSAWLQPWAGLRARGPRYSLSEALLPSMGHSPASPMRPGNPGLSSRGAVTHIRVPLWLLAFLCLAWPVTSFIVARRTRRSRGFEMGAKAAGSTPLPPGEVDAERSGADGEGKREG